MNVYEALTMMAADVNERAARHSEAVGRWEDAADDAVNPHHERRFLVEAELAAERHRALHDEMALIIRVADAAGVTPEQRAALMDALGGDPTC